MKLIRPLLMTVFFGAALGLTACGGATGTSTTSTDDSSDTTGDSTGDSTDTTGTDDDSATATGTMSFFATSEGNGASGGNLGGTDGGDTICQNLINASNASDAIKAKTWKAYLCDSAQDAKDVIGSGPWFDFNGVEVASSVADLQATGIASSSILDETGDAIPSDEHDILTGCSTDGTLISGAEAFPDNSAAASPTCQDWSSNSADSYGWVGHADWDQGDNETWSSEHAAACSQTGLQATAGSGRIYCFAAD